jgi:hypothetical protein
MGLRRANSDTVQIPVGEDGDTLTVRQGISKRDFNALLKALPDDYDASAGFTPGTASDFTVGLFSALVVGWSSPNQCTVDEYLALEISDAGDVDTALLEHFNALSPSAADRKSGEGDSPRPRTRSKGRDETSE